MAIDPVSQFPTALDSIEDPASTDNLDTLNREHDLLHQKVNDAIEKIQAKVGIDASTVPTSLEYKTAKEGEANTFTVGPQTVETGAAANKGLVVKGAAGQTAALQEWRTDVGDLLASVNAVGTIPLLDVVTKQDHPGWRHTYTRANGLLAVTSRPARLIATITSDDIPDPGTSWQLYRGFESDVFYGSTGASAVAAKGTAQALTARVTVENSGSDKNEFAAYVGQVLNKATVTPGRVWQGDYKAFGPVNVQPSELSGMSMLVENYYNGSPARGPSGAIWAVRFPVQIGEPHNSGVRYPVDVGIGVVGTSDAGGRGFTTGVRVGGTGSPWAATGSRFGDGVRVTDFDTTGILIDSPNAVGAVSLAVKAGAGQTGNLQEWRDAADALLGAIKVSGRVVSQVPATAPVDGDLANSQMSPYLDEAAGAVAFRAKKSDGSLATYRTSDTGAKKAYKSVDEVVNNSAVLQDDNHLVIALGANEVWSLRALIFLITSSTADIKFKWSVPVGATMKWARDGAFNGVGAGGTPEGVLTEASTFVMGGSGAMVGVGLQGTVFMGATAGNLQLQWAQTTAEVSDTTVQQGSFLRTDKLA